MKKREKCDKESKQTIFFLAQCSVPVYLLSHIKVLCEKDPFTIIILVSYSQAHSLNISWSLKHKETSIVF